MWIDDQIISQSHKRMAHSVWVPKKLIIVLGRSNEASKELHLERCRRDGITILRRYGGGGAVVLHPGCLIISLGFWVGSYYRNAYFFEVINGSIIELLQNSYQNGILDLRLAGISDIAIGERKIAGTSMYRSRNYLLYQASILVENQVTTIDRYLPHPSSEPKYRLQRSHYDFLGAINDAETKLGLGFLQDQFDANLGELVEEKLEKDLIDPIYKQIEYLEKKITSSEAIFLSEAQGPDHD